MIHALFFLWGRWVEIHQFSALKPHFRHLLMNFPKTAVLGKPQFDHDSFPVRSSRHPSVQDLRVVWGTQRFWIVHVWSHGEVTNVSLRTTTFDILGGKHSLNPRTMKRTDEVPKKIHTKQCGDGSKPIKCHIWGDGHPFYIILPVVCITILGIPWGPWQRFHPLVTTRVALASLIGFS